MKIFIKLMIFIVILACASPFILKDPYGNALLNTDMMQTPDLPSWADLKNESNSLFSGNKEKQKPDNLKVYKWIDKKGVTHYSEKENPDYNSNKTELKPISIQPSYQSTFSKKTVVSDKPGGLTSIPVQDVSKLINDTRQVKQIMENRGNQINKALR